MSITITIYAKTHFAYLFLFFILFGCQSEEAITAHEPKLDYYVESYDIPDLGFQPQLKVTYEYNSSGKLSKYRVLSYHPDLKSFDELRHLDFIYSDNLVSKILGYLPDEPTLTWNTLMNTSRMAGSPKSRRLTLILE